MKGQRNSFLKSIENIKKEILWGNQLRRNRCLEGGGTSHSVPGPAALAAPPPRLVDTAIVLLPWEVRTAPQAILTGLLLPSPHLADPNTVFFT